MIIAANWKMNLMKTQAVALAQSYRDMAKKHQELMANCPLEIVAFPPALYASIMQDYCDDPLFLWGGQSSYYEDEGAFTGNISAKMFASMGARWQLVGHSERRLHHAESDDDIARQINKAQAAGLKVMLCVGEDLAQRQAGEAEQIVTSQIARATRDVKDIASITIAYEPVWAIGTGQVASPGDVRDMHQAIADFCLSLKGASKAPQILYGGSVNASNAADLFSLPYVDGALVGGASLTADAFEGIIKVALSQEAM